MTPATILIVEDDADLREELSDYLSNVGYHVRGVASVALAEAALIDGIDLLVLDINLPDGSGLDLCRRLRPHIRSGIVMCTGRSERDLRITALKDGADAYLVKPVDPQELEATLASVFRRTRRADYSLLQQPPQPVQWHLDRTRRTITTPNGVQIKLSVGECLMLIQVLNSPQRQATRTALLLAFVAAGTASDGRRLETLVSRLRSKVQDKSGVRLPLQPIYGKGYAFTDYAECV